jgi:hypothetical protein
MSTDVSEEHAIFIFRDEEYAKQETSMKQIASRASRWYLAWRILLSSRWMRHVSPKRRFTFNGLHDVIPQKVGIFITSNHAQIMNRTGNRSRRMREKDMIKKGEKMV